MQEQPSPECGCAAIPSHLDRCRRHPVNIDGGDDVYLWHPPLTEAKYADAIPGFRPHNQSVNSRQLNPKGKFTDVLYNHQTGEVMRMEIAKLDVNAIREIKIEHPDPRLKDSTKKDAPGVVTFDVVHAPEPCMYPHCEILPRKNGEPRKDTPKWAISDFHRLIVDIANLYREEMVREHAL